MAFDVLVRRLATSVTLFCVALVACTLVVAAFPGLRARLGLVVIETPSYAVGDQIDVPASMYDVRPLTVLLFARSTCGTCESAAPTFSAMLAPVHLNQQGAIRLISTGANQVDELAYARRIGLDDADMQTLDVKGLRLRLVPTLLVVDRRGVVRYASEGVPPPVQQDEFLRVVRTLAAER